jgi:hypothetical protein
MWTYTYMETTCGYVCACVCVCVCVCVCMSIYIYTDGHILTYR